MFRIFSKTKNTLIKGSGSGGDSILRPWLPSLTPAPLDVLRSFKLRHFFGVQDVDRFRLAVEEIEASVVPGCFSSDNLIVFGRNNSMLDDEAFVQAWSSNAESDSDKAIIWR